ncbi:MAG TPA: TIGR00282 family metallophosphoesterase, partial [Gemmatales bacterium]|nr:TIGR00282 family metallophosphoesterase [Gemmatales bacterium]
MRLLFLGDVVGEPGLRLVCAAVPVLRRHEALDLVVANAENVCDGAGLAPSQFRRLRKAGVDAVTMGDHLFRKREIITLLTDPEPRVCRPANLPAAAPGRGWIVVPAADGTPVGIISLLGRQYMKPADCPYAAAEAALADLEPRVRVKLVDFHAEATAEKVALARWLDGRVSAFVGTHTHVATADEQILAKGTAYLTDVGMTGPYDGVLGRRADRVIDYQRTGVPASFEV